MHITNQKLSFDIFTRYLQNIFMEHDLNDFWYTRNDKYNVLLAKPAAYDCVYAPGTHIMIIPQTSGSEGSRSQHEIIIITHPWSSVVIKPASAWCQSLVEELRRCSPGLCFICPCHVLSLHVVCLSSESGLFSFCQRVMKHSNRLRSWKTAERQTRDRETAHDSLLWRRRRKSQTPCALLKSMTQMIRSVVRTEACHQSPSRVWSNHCLAFLSCFQIPNRFCIYSTAQITCFQRDAKFTFQVVWT